MFHQNNKIKYFIHTIQGLWLYFFFQTMSDLLIRQTINLNFNLIIQEQAPISYFITFEWLLFLDRIMKADQLYHWKCLIPFLIFSN